MKPVEWSSHLAQRFFSKAEEDPQTGCWVWTRHTDPKGYGRFQYGSRDQRLAYQVSYGLMVGMVEERLELDHLCRNTTCVNPYHLEPVPPEVNRQRATAARTHCPAGHPYDSVNTYWAPGGARVCRTCRSESQRVDRERRKEARRLRGPLPRKRPEICKWGHPFDESNTYLYRGILHCRACRNRRQRERTARKRAQ